MVQNALLGVDITTSNVTVVNGKIAITGTVNSGTALNTSVAQSDGFSGDGVEGVLIDPVVSLTAKIQATGTSGAIAIIGNTAGSVSDGSDSTNYEHDNQGVVIEDNGTLVSSAGNGKQSPLSAAPRPTTASISKAPPAALY